MPKIEKNQHKIFVPMYIIISYQTSAPNLSIIDDRLYSFGPLFHDLPVMKALGVGKPCCGVWAPVPICPVLGVLGVPAAE